MGRKPKIEQLQEEIRRLKRHEPLRKRLHRGFLQEDIKARKGVKSLEGKAKKYLGKQFHQLFRVHSNPTGFLKMISANRHLTDVQKTKALKTYIRKHGRRSSTLD